jgi:hypothetical protein
MPMVFRIPEYMVKIVFIDSNEVDKKTCIGTDSNPRFCAPIFLRFFTVHNTTQRSYGRITVVVSVFSMGKMVI